MHKVFYTLHLMCRDSATQTNIKICMWALIRYYLPSTVFSTPILLLSQFIKFKYYLLLSYHFVILSYLTHYQYLTVALFFLEILPSFGFQDTKLLVFSLSGESFQVFSFVDSSSFPRHHPDLPELNFWTSISIYSLFLGALTQSHCFIYHPYLMISSLCSGSGLFWTWVFNFLDMSTSIYDRYLNRHWTPSLPPPDLLLL